MLVKRANEGAAIRVESKIEYAEVCNFRPCCAFISCQPLKNSNFLAWPELLVNGILRRVALGSRMSSSGFNYMMGYGTVPDMKILHLKEHGRKDAQLLKTRSYSNQLTCFSGSDTQGRDELFPDFLFTCRQFGIDKISKDCTRVT